MIIVDLLYVKSIPATRLSSHDDNEKEFACFIVLDEISSLKGIDRTWQVASNQIKLPCKSVIFAIGSQSSLIADPETSGTPEDFVARDAVT